MTSHPVIEVDNDRIDALARELTTVLGEDAISRSDRALDRASRDGSDLSPIIRAQLPLGRAQLVAYPRTAEQIAQTVAAAVRHDVPITPRGKGTANYGQTLPMAGGLVLDTTAANTIHEIGDGYVIADAGAVLSKIEQAAVETGQELLIYPSTISSSLGGFVSGGSGGTGSIKNGMLHTGFVRELDVVHAVPDAQLIHLVGDEVDPYIHNYGTAGIIARLMINLEPLQDWRAFYASFDTFQQVLDLIVPMSSMEPTPRLVSGDPAVLADALPKNPGIPKGRASLRAILDPATVEQASAMVAAAGGRVELIDEGSRASLRLSMTSYNHPIQFLQTAYPNTYFHVEVSGDALTTRIDEVEGVYDGGMLHIEGQRDRPIGMLVGRFQSAEEVYAGFDRLTALGVGYHNPHQWYVDYEPERTVAVAARTDPGGLLNPGKLQQSKVATGSQL